MAEPEVVRSGETVVVQLPGLKTEADRERAKDIIGTTAKLQYHQVLADLGPVTPGEPGGSDEVTPSSTPGSTSPATTAPPTTAAAPDTNENSKGSLTGDLQPVSYRAPATTTPPTTTTTTPPTTAPEGPTTTLSVEDQIQAFIDQNPGSGIYTGDGGRYILGPVLFDGTILSSADAQLNPQTGDWEVNVQVKDAHKDEVNKVFNECFAGADVCPPIRTGDDGGQHGAVAMVLDGAVISAPTVNAVDLPKNPNGFVITGDFTQRSAEALALQLRYGALPVEFEPATLETVSATLGANALEAGVVAGLVGLVAVAIYMLVFYRLLGLVAIISLLTCAGYLWIVISYMGDHNGLALTLAGITGIIVSVGVAVDSNVVFYEALREDMTKGRPLRGTVRPSFEVAWKTILSADFVSLLGAGILYMLTIGPVRGFAFYLGLSTLIDLIASWFFMRPVVYWLASRRYFNERPGLLGVRPHRSGTVDFEPTAAPEATT